MVYRLLSLWFGLMALGALAAAGYFYFRPAPAADERGLVVEEPERVLKDVVVGRSYQLAFRVHNSSTRTCRVVGAEGS